ncbi:hypothetical protein [Clostridium sp. Marseille-Q2269]|uniref:hypothetical protein n=1 Tax=Clostridium sp. Marseille-Q2269 TaxID=2942205 RepID=UPI002073BFC9|nr:hypothetical protein [Clostridium sp. Marseille-Q2269]
MISKIFLKDMITKKTIERYIIAILLFYIACIEYLGAFIKPIINEKTLIWITVVVTITSNAYIIHTYSLFEKVKNYISLPINKKRFLLSFTFSLIIISLLERISFIIVIAFLYVYNPLENIFLIISTVILCIEIDVWILLLLNRKRKVQWIPLIFLLLCIILSFILHISILNKFLILYLCIVISLISILKKNSLDIAIRRNNRNILGKLRYSKNYFLKVFINEKIYLINTFMLIAIVCFLTLISKSNYIIWCLTWSIGAINTPILTMLSGDLYIRKQANMLPNDSTSIWNMYKKFLGSYFLCGNILIFILNIFTGSMPFILNIITFILLSIIEPIIGYLLELKIPLLNWKTKQQLWKHPRKYILPLIIFLLTSLIGLF